MKEIAALEDIINQIPKQKHGIPFMHSLREWKASWVWNLIYLKDSK